MFARMVVTIAAVSGLLAAVSYLPAQSNEPAKATLSGQVVGDDDQPVAGASVTQIGWKQAGPAVKADAEGRFSVSVEAAANGYIYAALYAQSDDGRLGFVTVEQTKPEPLRVVLKPARELDVVVQDRDGKAVAGAEVQFLANMRLLEVGTTDAEGRLKRRVPAEVRGWAVLARKSHLGFDYRTAERGRGATDTNPLPNEVTLKLDGARSVRVRAVDHRGQAVAGVKIGPWYIRKPGHEADINLSGATSLWPTTDAAGEVVLDWLPEKFEQALPLISRADDYYAREHSVAIQAENPVSELTIELLPLERLSGRVTHADGSAAGGMNVMVRGQGTSHNGFQGATTTDGEGRYELKVYSEQAYLVRAGDEKLASPVHSDIVVRAGKPVAGIDLVVGPATRVRGRVTVGQDRRPVAKLYLSAVIDKGAITKELSRKGDDRYYYGLRMNFNAQTDAEGNYSFLLGPGEYQLSGPARTEPFKFTIPQSDPPAEIVYDFHMPRAETGPLAVHVVDREGRAVPGAVVEGRYASQSARRWFGETKADDQGAMQVERSLDPLVVFARSADKKLAGIVRSEAEEAEAKVVIGPVASAKGTLHDLEGNAVAERELTYGIRIFQGEPLRSPFSDSFGGATKTDAQGRFSLAGLVPGETYQLNVKLDEHSSRTITEVIAKDAAPLDLGELSADPNPTRPYVPPTPAERAAQGFAAKGDLPLAERLENLLAEARREYTQPLLLFGKADDPACIELYRLFEQREALSDEEKAKGDYLSPDELRWEFELAALDVDRPEVREQAAKLKIELAAGVPALAVLDQSGALLETLPLTMKDKKLDRRQIGGWLAQHKLPTRDAQQMLDEALAKAQKEDKRVFFILSASWCGPCRMLARFLAPHKSELEKHFVFVKLDVSRDEHADELKERFKESASGGVPWYCIVNPADGKVLSTSNLPEVNPQYGTSNMGFPTLPNEVEHFIGMLKSTAPRLKEERLAEYKAELLKKK